MRFIEFNNGLQMPLNNEEADLLARFESVEDRIQKNNLTEREQFVANQLVNRGALVRNNQDGKITFRRQNRS